MKESDRLCDLMKQGFMKPMKQKKEPKKLKVIACEKCQDWHSEGKHHKKTKPL